MSRLGFLTKYAKPEHYDAISEIDKIMDAPDRYRDKIEALDHPKVLSRHIDSGLRNIHSSYVREAAAKSPNATEDQISFALKDSEPGVRYCAVSNPNATEAHIDAGLKDSSLMVYSRAAQYLRSSRNVDAALSHEHPKIRGYALMSPHATEDHLLKGLNDSDSYVSKWVMTNKNVTPKVVEAAMQHPNQGIRMQAARSHAATPEQLDRMIASDDPVVSTLAANHKIVKLREIFNDPLIKESLDSTTPKETVPEDSMLHQMGSMSASMIGGENFKMHKIGKEGYLIQFDKDGATEVHHVDENLSGGHLKGLAAPSMKMVSTFKNHIQGLVDSGKKVRIVAHDKLADGFAKITQRVLSKNPEYKMSAPIESEHEITGDKMKSWELTK